VIAGESHESRPWGPALGWLAFLGPFFYVTYGAANALAARRTHVPSIVFDWEYGIPFAGWTIFPYWSINLFYAASLFVCVNSTELAAHARRLLTAQVVAVACFVLFPLRFTFTQPDTSGAVGFMFDALTSFDRPFNQAPSLHIALLVILWRLYSTHLPKRAQWPLHIWFSLIGLSVLTTYQHHFFDIPTGALLGAFCLWMWPERGAGPLVNAAIATDRRRTTLAARYLLGSGLVAAVALWIGGAGWWLLWPAVSLAVVAANYAVLGADGFQKAATGRMSVGALLLLAPYVAGAFVNSRAWTRGAPAPVEVGDGVFLGRIPLAQESARFRAVVDVSAELPGADRERWLCIPMLDLVPPSAPQLRRAADSIAVARANGPVLVCCALGYSRSAAAVATWLLLSRTSDTIAEAIARIRGVRPRIVIDAGLRSAIANAVDEKS
jgi:Dual specificity phosphatase, catalytic domain